jgi:hypothetical protein
VLEGEFSDTVVNQPELLAHHFTQAGLNDRAVPHWIRSGQRALERVALAEAVAHLTTALTVNNRLSETVKRDRDELQIRLLLASAYFASLGWAAIEVPHTLNPARDLARHLGEREELTSILYYMWFHHGMRCEYEMADAANAELYSLARSTGDSKAFITAQMIDASTLCWKGEFVGSRRAAAEVSAAYEPKAHGDLVQTLNHDPKCLAQIWASAAIWSLGYPDQALEFALDQLSLARQLGHVWNLLWGLTGGSLALLFRGEAKLMLEWCEEARVIGHDRAMRIVELSLYPFWSGCAMIALDEHQEGYARLYSGAEVWGATGGVHLMPLAKVLLAQACLGMGQTEQAEALVRDATELIERTGHRMYEVEAHRVLGEVLLKETAGMKGPLQGRFSKRLKWRSRSEPSPGNCVRQPAMHVSCDRRED